MGHLQIRGVKEIEVGGGCFKKPFQASREPFVVFFDEAT
jgi:hypothetical protein